MRRKLLENEVIIKKWGQLNLSNLRLWIEAGDDDNYFLNSIELYKIQGHSIIKYANNFLLTLAVLSFFASPLSVLILKFALKEFFSDYGHQNIILLMGGLSFLGLGAYFFWKFHSTRSLTLNFQAGSRSIYFRLSDQFARIEDALEFSNLVDAQIYQLKVKPDDPPRIDVLNDKAISFKIS